MSSSVAAGVAVNGDVTKGVLLPGSEAKRALRAAGHRGKIRRHACGGHTMTFHVSMGKLYRRRRRMLVSMPVALLAACIGIGAWTAQIARSDVGSSNVTSYIVKPGDTLWAYASSITPQGDDVSETVDELIALNDLDSGTLRAGQRIIVPNE